MIRYKPLILSIKADEFHTFVYKKLDQHWISCRMADKGLFRSTMAKLKPKSI